MARDYKPVELRPVDDDAVKPAPVIRLENRDTEQQAKHVHAIRLGPHASEPDVSQRLDLPSREDSELRTHQPGIEAIIEADAPLPEQLEEYWGEESSRRRPIPWGWFALIALAIAGALLWSLTRVRKADVQALQIRSATASAIIEDAKEELAARQLIDRIHRNLKDFCSASAVEALVPLIRQPERVAPLMRRYYADRPLVAKRLVAITQLEPLTLGDYANFWSASVVLADHSTLQIIVETTESGEALIDWETVVCYQPMNWDDFVAQRPAGAAMDFRVTARPDNYYNHEFGNSERWTCFRLTAPGSGECLYGYAPAGSAVERDIQREIDQNDSREATLILRLRRSPGQQSPNGITIEKLLSPRWIHVVPPAAGS